MRAVSRSFWSCLLMLSVVACDDGNDVPLDASGDAAVLADSDGDGIADDHEERTARTDTDGDGLADFEDPDSDGDGISDADEAGDTSSATPPNDTDGDTIPDFRDTDSDDNGIPDQTEGTGDHDGDGTPDYRDRDDDNDFVRDGDEIDGVLSPLADTDGDGQPNYRDIDSDDDLIMDGDEHGFDTDGDGLLDSEDDDSDGDGVSDRDEAGDTDLRSPPVDTDEDTRPDFRDADSDNDGLSDTAEVAGGTSPVSGDSDRDGVSDLIEIAAGTDPLDGTISPRTRGDFVFVVPFEEDPTPPRDTLEFRTNVQFADIYFLFDESGSMSGEIGALRTAVTTLVSDLTCVDSGTACVRDSGCGAGQICSSFTNTCIEDPSTSACLLSPWTGVGKYEVDYDNVLSLQPSASATSTALGFPTPGGTENLYGAVWGVADPTGAPGPESACAVPMPGRIGCPAYREEAVRILIAFTDENSDDGLLPMPVGAALQAAGISFIGVWTGTPSSTERQDLVHIANASESFDRDGAPLVFDGQDSAIVPVVSRAINEIVEGVPLRATIEATDEPDDAGDSLQFIEYLEVNVSGGRCSAIGARVDTDGDGHDDAFPAILPGTPVCWDIVAARNVTVEPTLEPLVFRARLTVLGDGSPLDSRVVYFLVPPTIPEPMGPG